MNGEMLLQHAAGVVEKRREHYGEPAALFDQRFGQRLDEYLLRQEYVLRFAGAFVAAFVTVGARMGVLASTEPAEPQTAATGASIRS